MTEKTQTTDNSREKDFLSRPCSQEELAQFDAQTNSPEKCRAYFEQEELVFLAKEKPLSEDELQQAEDRLLAKIQAASPVRNKRIINRHILQYAAIIAVLFMCGISAVHFWQNTNHSNPIAQINVYSGNQVKELLLPDGTHVWLNKNTKIHYSPNFSGKTRNVFISGEAYFEVKHNEKKPFIVESKLISARVLGTTFNFNSNPHSNKSEVTLISGEVQVRGNHNEGMIILTPGQKAEIEASSKRLTVKMVDAPLEAIWRSDLIPFENDNLQSIAKKLETIYKVRIKFSNAINTQDTYSGVLKKRETIDSVLRSLSNTIPIKYKIKGNNIIISRN